MTFYLRLGDPSSSSESVRTSTTIQADHLSTITDLTSQLNEERRLNQKLKQELDDVYAHCDTCASKRRAMSVSSMLRVGSEDCSMYESVHPNYPGRRISGSLCHSNQFQESTRDQSVSSLPLIDTSTKYPEAMIGHYHGSPRHSAPSTVSPSEENVSQPSSSGERLVECAQFSCRSCLARNVKVWPYCLDVRSFLTALVVRWGSTVPAMLEGVTN